MLDLPWWLPVFDSGARRAVSGLKSAGAVVSYPGARQRAAGALAVSAQNHHLLGKVEGLGNFTLRELRRMGLWAGNARKHVGFIGLGLKTITRLLWVYRSPDKIKP